MTPLGFKGLNLLLRELEPKMDPGGQSIVLHCHICSLNRFPYWQGWNVHNPRDLKPCTLLCVASK